MSEPNDQNSDGVQQVLQDISEEAQKSDEDRKRDRIEAFFNRNKDNINYKTGSPHRRCTVVKKNNNKVSEVHRRSQWKLFRAENLDWTDERHDYCLRRVGDGPDLAFSVQSFHLIEEGKGRIVIDHSPEEVADTV